MSDVSLPAWISQQSGGSLLTIHVVPRASRNEVSGERGGALLVRLAAPPVEGAANRALAAFLATALGVSKGRIVLVSGEKSRDKRVLVRAADAAGVVSRLLEGTLRG